MNHKDPSNKIDFSEYKFRCSSLPTLMVQSRSKDPLSETTKAHLREIWIKEVFGREKYDAKSKYTDKGVACESDSLDLIKEVTGKTYFKNQKNLANDWITGTPDVIDKEAVIDTKTSWDLWTFAAVTEESAKKDYYWQMIGYMWLTEKEHAILAYCLVDTPEDIISGELYRLSFRYPDIGVSDENDKKYRKNYIFSDIAPALRMKEILFDFNAEDVEEVKVKIEQCRQYLNGLSL
jgi:hypothetical protein